MVEIDAKKLNEKLLKFAGFYKKEWISEILWHYPTDYGADVKFKEPNLVKCLELQTKYLYPKLKENQCYVTKKYNYETDDYAVFIYRLSKPPIESVGQKSEALAFALAVEKLINSLEKKDGKH